MSNIEYRQNFPLNALDILRLFESSGIRRPTDDVHRIERMFANSNLIISAWHEDHLIGVCRALTDLNYCCYLSDIAVDRNFQNHGIGSELIARIKAFIGNEVSLILISAPGAQEFYERIGFERSQYCFTAKRSK